MAHFFTSADAWLISGSEGISRTSNLQHESTVFSTYKVRGGRKPGGPDRSWCEGQGALSLRGGACRIILQSLYIRLIGGVSGGTYSVQGTLEFQFLSTRDRPGHPRSLARASFSFRNSARQPRHAHAHQAIQPLSYRYIF